jgi:hypothetical protein
MPAKDLWRKMLSMLFETGHPWITFKDACNVRSPQQHVGVVHSSNLCTEITLNTSDTEIAVCNLGSVNLAQHLKDGQIDQDKLKRTTTAMRMLDNVIDINYYAVKKARDSNLRHRPVGLGIMGFQDACTSCACPTPARGGGVCRPLDGSRLLPRLLGQHRAGRRARPLQQLPRQPVGPRHPAAGHAGPAGPAARRLCRGGPLARWTGTRCAQASPSTACATATAWPSRPRPPSPTSSASTRRSSPASATCRSSQPVGRVHRHQRVPGARPQAPGPVGRRDGDGPQALRRLAAPIDRVPEELKRLYATAFEVEPPGWWRPRRGARSGSTRRSR